MAGELLARHLLVTQTAREAKALHPDSIDLSALPDDSIVIVDHQGLPAPFDFARKVRSANRRIGLILHVEVASDYLNWKAGIGGFRGVVSSSDGLEAWADALNSGSGGLFLTPGARPNPEDRILHRLTNRQREVYELTVLGCTDACIAERLGLAESTVETHRRDLNHRLGCHSWAELMVCAIRHGVVTAAGVRFAPSEKRSLRSHSAREESTAAPVNSQLVG